MSTTEAEAPTVHILWINAGLSCDGDSVALTAATQPSIEEIALGALPGPAEGRRPLAVDRLRQRPGRRQQRLHRVVLQGRAGRARPVRARRRGLDPEREDQARGLLVRVRQQPRDRAADDHQRVARPARPQGARRARGRHLRDLRRHPRDGGQPDRRDGRGGLPRLGLQDPRRHPDRQRAGLPGAPGQPLRDDPVPALPGHRRGADDPAGRRGPPDVALRPDGARGLRPRRLLRAGPVRHRVRLAAVPGEAGLLGPGRQVQRPQARLDQRRGRLPERRRDLHRLHDAGLPGQVHAVHGRPARQQGLRRRERRVRRHHPQAARDHRAQARQGTDAGARRAAS